MLLFILLQDASYLVYFYHTHCRLVIRVRKKMLTYEFKGLLEHKNRDIYSELVVDSKKLVG